MKLLHTADWHVGKTVRGQSRADEHIAVLAEIAGIADDEAADVVLVVGDVFDVAAPAPESERIVYQALLDLSAKGERPVVVVSGNHDNPRRLGAVTPVFDLANVHVQTAVRPPDDGGVLELTTAGGESLRLALLPFLSQRHVVRAADLMALDATETGGHYAARLAQIIDILTSGFAPDAVNIVLAHLMVSGGVLGGGERSAHTIFDYWVTANAFPASAHYVALGHLHRPQRLDAPCPVWYCGSPLAMDFGEGEDRKAVLLIEAEVGVPAAVREVPLTAGRRFRTVKGSLADLAAVASDDPGRAEHDYVRVVVLEKARVGLADEVRELFPGAVDIKIDSGGPEPKGTAPVDRPGQSPHDLFGAYLDENGVDDARLLALFDDLLERALEADDTGGSGAEEQIGAS